jgi:hypothetical protein
MKFALIIGNKACKIALEVIILEKDEAIGISLVFLCHWRIGLFVVGTDGHSFTYEKEQQISLVFELFVEFLASG